MTNRNPRSYGKINPGLFHSSETFAHMLSMLSNVLTPASFTLCYMHEEALLCLPTNQEARRGPAQRPEGSSGPGKARAQRAGSAQPLAAPCLSACLDVCVTAVIMIITQVP